MLFSPLRFGSRYAEPDRVPCLPDRSALPAGRVQRLLRGLPGHHHRAATRFVLDALVSFPTARNWDAAIIASGSVKLCTAN